MEARPGCFGKWKSAVASIVYWGSGDERAVELLVARVGRAAPQQARHHVAQRLAPALLQQRHALLEPRHINKQKRSFLNFFYIHSSLDFLNQLQLST